MKFRFWVVAPGEQKTIYGYLVASPGDILKRDGSRYSVEREGPVQRPLRCGDDGSWDDDERGHCDAPAEVGFAECGTASYFCWRCALTVPDWRVWLFRALEDKVKKGETPVICE